MRIAAALAVSCVLFPGTLVAQEVTGVLRAEQSGAPVGGVVLTAQRVADREIVGRTISSRSGAFRLGVGTDSVLVLALRIGQRPVELWRGRLAARERQEIGGTLPDVPVTISTFRVRERARCGAPSADETSVTRALFADALTALSASLGTVQGGAPVVRMVLTEQFRDLRNRVQSTSPPMPRTGATAQPFRSVSVVTLMREGFVVNERDGTQLYRAPDAHVLTSNAFLSRYCLSLALDREAEGLVGIRFTPQRTPRNMVSVRGVLWLDLPTRALRRLEFDYVGLTQAETPADPGGVVEYAQLADGRWIIDRWSLRIPTLISEVVTDPTGISRRPRSRATGVRVVGGAVLEARLGRALLYSVGGPRAERALTGQGDRAAADGGTADGAVVDDASVDRAASTTVARASGASCAATDDATTTVTGTVRRPDGTAVVNAQVQAEWHARFRRNAGQSGTWEMGRVTATSDAAGAFFLCRVPRDLRVSLLASHGVARTSTAQLRLPIEGGTAAVELTLAAQQE